MAEEPFPKGPSDASLGGERSMLGAVSFNVHHYECEQESLEGGDSRSDTHLCVGDRAGGAAPGLEELRG